MRRRDFMGLTACAVVAAPRLGLGQTGPNVAVVTGETRAAVRRAVMMMGGMSRFVRPGQSVVLKPNFSFPRAPEEAANTHPEVVAEVAALVKAAGAARVRALDNPLGPAERCLVRSGVREACEAVEKGMASAVENHEDFKAVPLPGGQALGETDVMRQVLETDVLIALPVAKSHSGAGVSLSLKGMMGLVYDRRIMHRRGLAETVVDINTVLRPALVLIDATRVLSSGGPGGPGKVLTPHTIIASTDPVAADAVAVSLFEWYGRKYEPRQVPHIKLAHERGLGRMDIENLLVERVSL